MVTMSVCCQLWDIESSAVSQTGCIQGDIRRAPTWRPAAIPSAAGQADAAEPTQFTGQFVMICYHHRILMGVAISDEHTLEFLLGFDGRIHHLEQGYWLKFEIRRTEPTTERPHGLRYAFTLHDPSGNRLVGFDNAHGVPPQGSRFRKPSVEHDHWHRTADDEGRPYPFTTADQLLADFEAEVERVLTELGIGKAVIDDGDVTDRRTS
jgi:hypothetical protein